MVLTAAPACSTVPAAPSTTTRYVTGPLHVPALSVVEPVNGVLLRIEVLEHAEATMGSRNGDTSPRRGKSWREPQASSCESLPAVTRVLSRRPSRSRGKPAPPMRTNPSLRSTPFRTAANDSPIRPGCRTLSRAGRDPGVDAPIRSCMCPPAVRRAAMTRGGGLSTTLHATELSHGHERRGCRLHGC